MAKYTITSGAKAGSPYLELPKRSEAEVRRERTAESFLRSEMAIASAYARALDHAYALTPAQRWLSSDHVTKTLEKFRKEDSRD